MSNFPGRGSSYKIISGGWVLYSEPNFEGKVVIHLPGGTVYITHTCFVSDKIKQNVSNSGECISNDPVVGGEASYKPWSGPFGSARPIRGIHYRFVSA